MSLPRDGHLSKLYEVNIANKERQSLGSGTGDVQLASEASPPRPASGNGERSQSEKVIFKSKSGGDVFASKGRKGRSRDVRSGSVENPVPQPATINDDTWSTKTPGDRLVIVMVWSSCEGKNVHWASPEAVSAFLPRLQNRDIQREGTTVEEYLVWMRRTHFLIQMIRKHQRNASSAQRWQCPT